VDSAIARPAQPGSASIAPKINFDIC
jgi:hypothetical protein